MEIFGKIVATFLTLAFIATLFSWFVMLLWNGCLVDAVDGVNRVTWLQAWGISILFSLLFKSSSVTTK